MKAPFNAIPPKESRYAGAGAAGRNRVGTGKKPFYCPAEKTI